VGGLIHASGFQNRRPRLATPARAQDRERRRDRQQVAHRSRLDVLKHIMGVSYAEILAEFEEGAVPGSALWVPDPGTGDVKYRHGATGDYPLRVGGARASTDSHTGV